MISIFNIKISASSSSKVNTNIDKSTQKEIDKNDPANLKILRLPKGKLFFGYKVIPLKKDQEEEKPVSFYFILYLCLF